MNTNESSCNGWGVGLSAIIGGALGYWAGRSGHPGMGYPPPMAPYAAPYAAAATVAAAGDGVGHCRTCYQEGVESGQSMAGLNYIGQRVAANANDIANVSATLSAQMTSQFNAIQNQFNALNQQKIADLVAENAALRTQNSIGMSAAATNASLASIENRLNALTAGCAVRAVPACPTTCSCANS